MKLQHYMSIGVGALACLSVLAQPVAANTVHDADKTKMKQDHPSGRTDIRQIVTDPENRNNKAIVMSVKGGLKHQSNKCRNEYRIGPNVKYGSTTTTVVSVNVNNLPRASSSPIFQYHGVPDRHHKDSKGNPREWYRNANISIYEDNGKFEIHRIKADTNKYSSGDPNSKTFAQKKNIPICSIKTNDSKKKCPQNTVNGKKSNWYTFTLQTKWSYKNDGWHKLYVNGVQRASYNGPTAYNDDTGPYLKYGIYMHSWNGAGDPKNAKCKGNGTKAVMFDNVQQIVGKAVVVCDQTGKLCNGKGTVSSAAQPPKSSASAPVKAASNAPAKSSAKAPSSSKAAVCRIENKGGQYPPAQQRFKRECESKGYQRTKCTGYQRNNGDRYVICEGKLKNASSAQSQSTQKASSSKSSSSSSNASKHCYTDVNTTNPSKGRQVFETRCKGYKKYVDSDRIVKNGKVYRRAASFKMNKGELPKNINAVKK